MTPHTTTRGRGRGGRAEGRRGMRGADTEGLGGPGFGPNGGPGGFPGPGAMRGPGGGRGRRGPGGDPMGRGRARGFGRPGGWQQVDLPPAEDASAWFAGRLPDGWFSAVEVTVDREEIVVIGTLPDAVEGGAAEAEGRIGRFRSDTRDERIGIAGEAEARYGRKVAWGARLGDTTVLFTHLAVPVMTRLRQPERRVLDTLVDAGVARSRSDALAWCVRLVDEHAEDWLSRLREAMSEVDKLRGEGPAL